jgi:Flp pilus assembly pilin Flp
MDRFNIWVGTLFARTQDLKKEDGQTFVEYALVLSAIVVGVLLLATWGGLKDGIQAAIDTVAGKLGA